MVDEKVLNNDKSKWKSKAFLAALVTVVVGAIQPVSTALGHPVTIPNWIIEVLVGFGLYGVRDAIGKDSALKAIALFFMLGAAQTGYSYNISDFGRDLRDDTKSSFLKDIKVGYFYDILEDENMRSKVGVSTTLLKWKFLSLDPSFIYTPIKSDSMGEVGFSVPVYLGEIPMGNGKLLKDILFPEEMNNNELWKRYYCGLYMSNNFENGHFGFGLNTGIKF